MPKLSEEQKEAVLDADFARAGEIFDELVETIAEEDDPIGVLYNLWVYLTRCLADHDWSVEQLTADVAYHVTHEQSEGSA